MSGNLLVGEVLHEPEVVLRDVLEAMEWAMKREGRMHGDDREDRFREVRSKIEEHGGRKSRCRERVVGFGTI